MTASRSALLAATFAACCASAAEAQQPAKPTFDHRRLIADNMDKMFSTEAKVRGVAVSELREVQSPVGLTWAACVRLGAATSITGSQTLPRVYVVTFTMRNQIAERREARGKDCAGAQFQPLK